MVRGDCWVGYGAEYQVDVMGEGFDLAEFEHGDVSTGDGDYLDIGDHARPTIVWAS